jgi:hypothetical protein
VTLRAAGPVLAFALLVTACAETTVDTPDPTAPAPTTGVATTDPLAALSAQTAALSAALIDNEGQREVLARIEELWAGVRPEIVEERPDLVEGFDAMIQLARRSVERRRPADADKAHKNLLILIAAYQG